MKLFQRFLALICLVLLFIFCISNTEPMIVRFLSWESAGLPTFLLLVFAFLTGMILALLWQSLRSVSRASGKKERLSRKSERKNKDVTQNTETPDEASNVEPDAAPTETVSTITEGDK